MEKNRDKLLLLPPGTDVSAIIWKMYQNEQIQSQLDQTHNVFKKNKRRRYSTKTPIKITTTTTEIAAKKNNSRLANIDALLENATADDYEESKPLDARGTKNAPNNKNIYAHKFQAVYDEYVCGNEDINSLLIRHFLNSPLTAENVIGTHFRDDFYFNADTRVLFSNIVHFIDFRKCKCWVSYMLSDGIERYGTIANHPIFNGMPGWLVDALQICAEGGGGDGEAKSRPTLYLVYSTDVRNVDKFLGHLCSIINVHQLLSLNLEKNTDLNATLILIHLMGILTPDTYNPINRQGICYPSSILQKTTFENVKNQLARASIKNKLYDNLCSFISATITCVPHNTGTNSFNLVIK